MSAELNSPNCFVLFQALESTNVQEANEAKNKFAELFNTTKENWLVNGLVHYYLSTGSIRVVDVLAKVPVPHDKHLCDKLSDGLRATWRVDSLGLLGHIVRKQPSWLHKMVNYPLFKDLLHVLKTEKEIKPLISGLLLLITLLPMIPTLITPHLQEVFSIFGRLAAWESNSTPAHQHLQFALYGLFQNLYGMFPCNFTDFIRKEYTKRENFEVFTHTVKPMLENVKYHPLLITASKNTETDTARWKKMEHHDVLVECRRFSSENTHKQRSAEEDNCFRSRCGTDVSTLTVSSTSHFQPAKSSNSTPNLTESQNIKNTQSDTITHISAINIENIEPGGDKWFSLHEACGASTLSAPQTPLPLPIGNFQDTPISQTPVSLIPSLAKQLDSGSPPEAAVEATPENTPIKDPKQRFFPTNSPVVRTLGPKLTQPNSIASISYSQPPSPLKKELSPFNRMSSIDASSNETEQRKDSFYTHSRLNRVLHDRSQQTPDNVVLAPSPQKQNVASPLKKVSSKDNAFVPSVPNSPVPLGTTAPISGSTDWPLAKPKPHKDGVPLSAKDNITNLYIDNKEDSEVTELMRSTSIRESNFFETDANKTITKYLHDVDNHEEGDTHWDDDMMCEGENSNCSEKNHGLHMPHSTSMLELVHRFTRSRFHSQCINESVKDSSTATSIMEMDKEGKKYKINIIQKASSCPDLKFGCDDIYKKIKSDKIDKKNGYENGNRDSFEVDYKSEETQTVEIWPLGYEYLFNDILQKVCDQNTKNGTICVYDDNFDSDFTPYLEVDKYIETVSQNNKRDDISKLRLELEILHLELFYERHRREVHAFRNRRLLGRSRKNRSAEEQNITLKQQIASLNNEKEELREQLNRQKQTMQNMEYKHQESIKQWQNHLSLRDSQLKTEREEVERLSSLLLEQRAIPNESHADIQHLRSALFDMSQQLQRALRKSEMCDRQTETIKRLQRELIMYGEKDTKYRELINALPSKTDMLVSKVTQQYKEQLVNAQDTSKAQASRVEYLQTREAELESMLTSKEMAAQDLKKQLRLVKEEYSEKLKSVEEKYQSIKRINQRMEAHYLELLQRVPQSPQTLSRDLTSGFSPQSSLSASLASSDGHAPLLSTRVDEIRNLQVIVNAHEIIEESTSNSVNNLNFDEDPAAH